MSAPKLTFCIVTYQAKEYLRQCLNSIRKGDFQFPYEIVIVDNASSDGTVGMLLEEFPEVTLIENDANLGYTKPMNQALLASRGEYLVQLNPDTLIIEGSLQKMVGYMGDHRRVGICGPKVLNRDGSFQPPCRRGEPRPLAVIGYFFKLGKIFPKNRALNEYLLSYMDEDEINSVAAVSGSCMLIRREVVDQIGYLDELFFAYQEDTDFCRRARLAGWDVVYYPEASIFHFGGQGGSRVQPFRSLYAWHYSYWLYYQKHLARDYFFLLNWIFYSLILGKFLAAVIKNIFSVEKTPGTRRP